MHYSCAVDLIDREILHLLQEDSTRSARELGAEVGLTPTPCWRRVQNLRREGIIQREVAILDPERLSLGINALVQIRTNDHSATWLADFAAAIEEFPEIVEAFRTSGEIDYMLRVVVPDIRSYDDFYKRLIERVALYDVRTIFEMEELKRTTALPLDYANFQFP
jgi:Lrp/AsnC family transcriptional regulator